MNGSALGTHGPSLASCFSIYREEIRSLRFVDSENEPALFVEKQRIVPPWTALRPPDNTAAAPFDDQTITVGDAPGNALESHEKTAALERFHHVDIAGSERKLPQRRRGTSGPSCDRGYRRIGFKALFVPYLLSGRGEEHGQSREDRDDPKSLQVRHPLLGRGDDLQDLVHGLFFDVAPENGHEADAAAAVLHRGQKRPVRDFHALRNDGPFVLFEGRITTP